MAKKKTNRRSSKKTATRRPANGSPANGSPNGRTVASGASRIRWNADRDAAIGAGIKKGHSSVASLTEFLREHRAFRDLAEDAVTEPKITTRLTQLRSMGLPIPRMSHGGERYTPDVDQLRSAFGL